MTNSVAPLTLRLIQKGVNAFNEFSFSEMATALVNVYPETGLDSQHHATRFNRRVFNNKAQSIGESHAVAELGIGQDKGKLFASKATGNIKTTDSLADQVSDMA